VWPVWGFIEAKTQQRQQQQQQLARVTSTPTRGANSPRWRRCMYCFKMPLFCWFAITPELCTSDYNKVLLGLVKRPPMTCCQRCRVFPDYSSFNSNLRI
jgi:hypothetical protein